MASVSTMFGEELTGEVDIWRKDMGAPLTGSIHDYRTDDNGGIILLHIRRPDGRRLVIPWHNISTIIPMQDKREEQR